MTEFEKRIYNTWLATTRKNCGKPFKLRKSWTGFTDKPEYMSIKKLAKLFKVYHNIDINEWFEAPYKLYTEKIQYDIKYYTQMRNYSTYRIYRQKKDNRNYTPKEFKELLQK